MKATPDVFDERDDAALIAAVRAGDTEAYGVLFSRHADSARRLARTLAPAGDADDLVADAFAKILPVLARGDGPDLAFRPYLLAAVRRLNVDRHRAGSRVEPTDDDTELELKLPAATAASTAAVASFESEAAARAFASLPERWQLVLWHTEVEGQRPAEIAPLLGVSPNAVSQLAHRAREGLRQAFVSMHVQEGTAAPAACQAARANFGAYIRSGLSRRESQRVAEHLGSCRECTGIYLELVEVDRDLRAFLAPLILGGAAAGYLGATPLAATPGPLGAFGGFLKTVPGKAAATVAAAGVTAAAVVTGAVVLAGSGPEPRAVANPSATTSSSSAPQSPNQPSPAATDAPTPSAPAPSAPAPTSPAPPESGAGAPPVTPPTEEPPGGQERPAPTSPSPTGGVGPRQPDRPASPPGEGRPTPSTPVVSAVISPTPSPSSTPTGIPSTPNQAPGEVDIRLSASQANLTVASVIAVHVHGLASSQTADVTLTAEGLSATLGLDPRCTLIGVNRATCQITGPTQLTFGVLTLPLVPTPLTITATPGGGLIDPVPANNTVQITLG